MAPSTRVPSFTVSHIPAAVEARLGQLGDRIAELSARIQAASWELLSPIREFDAEDGWSGCLSCAQWGGAPGSRLAPPASMCGVARALGEHSKSDAMRRGRISYPKARPVTRVATAKNELARSTTRSPAQRSTWSRSVGRGAALTARRSRPRTGGGTRVPASPPRGARGRLPRHARRRWGLVVPGAGQAAAVGGAAGARLDRGRVGTDERPLGGGRDRNRPAGGDAVLAGGSAGPPLAISALWRPRGERPAE